MIGDVLQVYSGKNGRAIIFNETKKEADNLSCSEHIKQDAHVLHGDIPQEKRETVLKVWNKIVTAQRGYVMSKCSGYNKTEKKKPGNMLHSK